MTALMSIPLLDIARMTGAAFAGILGCMFIVTLLLYKLVMNEGIKLASPAHAPWLAVSIIIFDLIVIVDRIERIGDIESTAFMPLTFVALVCQLIGQVQINRHLWDKLKNKQSGEGI